MKLNCPENIEIECILFDLDGVMVHPWGFARLLETKYDISREATKTFFEKTFPDCAIDKTDLKDVLPPYLSQWGWKKSVDEFVHEWLVSEDLADKEMVDLVKSLRKAGCKCCLATNQERHRANFISKEMDFESLFDHLFISCNLKTMKPELSYFQKIQAALGIPANKLFFLDDQEHYISAAIECGWNAQVFTSHEDLFDLSKPFSFSK